MSDYQPTADEPIDAEAEDTADDPQFGLIDVIEAFTAMRQEWRNQSRESRELTQSLAGTSAGIAELEQRLLGAVAKIQEAAADATSDDASRRLAETIAEIDHHVSRAVNAVTRSSQTNSYSLDTNSLKSQIAADFQSRGMIGRWFYQPLLTKIEASVNRWAETATPRADEASHHGLQMLADRVQRLMTDQHIERIETIGKPFDGKMMNALEAVSPSTQPSGTVVEQLAPAYNWQGRLIKYAQVRIAK